MTDVLSLWAALEQIRDEQPYIYLKEAMEKAKLRVLGLDEPPAPAPPFHLIQNPVWFGKWIGESVPSAVSYIEGGKLINAIKEVRVATAAGLKEAKEGVEALRYQMGLSPKPHFYGNSKSYDAYEKEIIG